MLLWSLDWTQVSGGSTTSTGGSTNSTFVGPSSGGASTRWVDGGTHIEGVLVIGGIGFQYPNSTQVYLRGDGNWRMLRWSPLSTIVAISSRVLVIQNGVIVNLI